MKYGLVVDGTMLCDPIDEHVRLVGMVARQGFPIANIQTPLTEPVVLEIAGRKLELLPGHDVVDPAPAAIGFDGQYSAWQVDSENQVIRREYKYRPMVFADAAEDLLRYIDHEQDQALGMIERGYTEQEVKTWAQQQAEAAAWTADHTISVPLVESLAERRGVTVEQAVAKIQAKASTAAILTGIILGDAQAAGDQINALKALHDSETDTLPDDWFDQLQAIATGWQKDWPPELLLQ